MPVRTAAAMSTGRSGLQSLEMTTRSIDRSPREQLRVLASFFPIDWRMNRRYRLPSGELQQPYYIYYPSGLIPDRPWPEVRFDFDGVAVTSEGHNPVTIGQYALYSHERLLRNVSGSRDVFLAQSRFLRDHQREDGAYPYETASPEYRAESGFISAMAQGLAASVLARAFALTDDSSYRDAAIRALGPLKRDVKSGGASYIRNGEVFFEEVATDDPCHILNGHLFAAFGIYDLSRFDSVDGELEDLHRAAIKTLERWLPRYDVRGWSYYHLAVRDGDIRHLAHLAYHQLHIAQLNVYAAMTGVAGFASMAARWQRSLDDYKMRARVWLDSASWLMEVSSERAGLIRRGPWRPIGRDYLKTMSPSAGAS